MATTDSTSQNSSNAVSISLENGTVSDISTSLENATLHDPQEDPPQSTNTEIHDSPRRKLNVYPRPHILFLSKSPLVKTPKGMPTLKEWFGDWNDQQSSSKKDPEASGPTLGTRDRRFRRDADDSELPSRPAFRTTPSQPSQMGNFRHQSTRTTEREKDKDTDKERERDIRDKEGAEKLRSLSDKYDRDRLALSASSLRNKDRDSAPHLSAGSSTRLGQAQGANGTRRAEGREPAKRKPGESEDWRRGSEPSRSGREDRSDNGRRERDTRERPRSRSRLRRDPSSTRRDRDRDRDDRLRDRRSDDRDETRRDKDDYFRRDLDDRSRDKDETYRDGRDRREQGDREVDDDSRRWRDDGKRDERIAARRDRGWERWESGTDRDRTDDRDGRSKRTTGRDRRSGADEGKDERREREKEKEPAWMETYVPSSPGAGILGGQSTEGELDGIQAWKKGLKEKERRDKELEDPPEPSTKKSPEHTSESLPATGADSGMDEIQLFKLMMKREAEKKDEPSQNGNVESSRLNGNVESSRLDALPSLSTGTSPLLRTDSKNALSSVASVDGAAAPHADAAAPRNGLTQTEPSRTTTNGLLSLVPSVSPVSAPHSVNTERQLLDSARDDLQPAVSRFFPNPPGLHSNGPNPDRSLDYSGTSPSASFNPPQGSRLLAFASRGSGNAAPGVDAHLKAPVALETSNLHSNPGTSFHNHSKVTVSDQSPNFGAEYQYGGNGRMLPSESSVAPRSYSPFGQPSHTFAYDDMQDSRLGNESLRRVSGLPPNQFSPASESSSPYQELGNSMSNISNNGPGYDAGSNPAGANYAAGKGSRFAKFFDAKREPQANPGRRTSAGAGFVSTSPRPGQRQDALAAMNGMGVPNAENRAMEDIFAMLQNSAQTHRMSPQLPQTNNRGVGGGGAPFGPSHAELQALQLQQLQQQQYAHNRIESLYDSRLDDRNFMPDGMVPGLRPAPRPRSREPSGQLFNEHLDDPLFGVQQRLPPQVRNLDQMYSGHLYNQHAHQGIGRGAPIQLQQAQFRGGPSPIQAGNRLPPGLANLGGRPPHDPSQFLNPSMGAPGSLHGGISTNAPAQPGFNNFGAGNLGFSGNPQGRGPIPGPHHQVPISLNQMAGLGPNSNLDLRGNQAQYLGMGGVGGLSGNLRGGNFNPQHGPGAQIPAPHLAALRQQQQQQQQQQQHQQQQHLPPHLVQQILPPHLQPQQGLPVGNAQGAQDLMALLMGNHRD